jgi:hypothetical protein
MVRTYKNQGSAGVGFSSLSLRTTDSFPEGRRVTLHLEGFQSIILSRAQARDLATQITAILGDEPAKDDAIIGEDFTK